MLTELEKLPFNEEELNQFSDRRSEPKWFADFRRQSLAAAESLPLPNPEKTRITDWNFTNFTYDIAVQPECTLEKLPEAVRRIVGAEKAAGALLVIHNGHPVYRVVPKALTDQGVIFTDLLSAIKEHPDLVRRYYFKTVQADRHRLRALHAALVNGGVFLYVPKHVELEMPVQTIYYQDAPRAGLVAHTLVIAAENSKSTYVESYISAANVEGVANLVSEVAIENGASLQFGAVDHLSAEISTYVCRSAHVDTDGNIQWALGQMNDGHTLSENETVLEGRGASCDTKAVSIGSGHQQASYDNYIRHIGQATLSRLLVRGAQKDAARAIFNARTKIERGAAQADGEQAQRVLMLSDEARGDANPILLIDEYDVIAGHAASVGRVDPDQLYYLMSRGIKKEMAEKLIVEGFLQPVVDLLPVEGVRTQLADLIERKVG
ncbi:MAG: Fe-S cluster assembly protein SufD [Sporolactobacillus sp.]